jgi:hypothetical protein
MPGQALADVKISFKLHGGWAYVSGGAVNAGTQVFFDRKKEGWPASEGGYRALHLGFELGGDIIFELSRTIGIGIGGGYLRISRPSRMDCSIPDSGISGVLLAEPKLSAIPIRLSLFLNYQLTDKTSFAANIGTICLFNARYSDEWDSWYSAADTTIGYELIETQAKKAGIPLGLNGGIGIEYKLFNKIYLCLDVQGRYARLRGLEGSSELSSDYFDPLSEQGKLYYESVPILYDEPRLIMVQSDPPDGPGGEPRLAVVDFSGVSLQAGIRIRI